MPGTCPLMSISSFSFPTAIRFGAGARKEVAQHLRDRGFTRPLIVTDKALGALPMPTFGSVAQGIEVCASCGVLGATTLQVSLVARGLDEGNSIKPLLLSATASPAWIEVSVVGLKAQPGESAISVTWLTAAVVSHWLSALAGSEHSAAVGSSKQPSARSVALSPISCTVFRLIPCNYDTFPSADTEILGKAASNRA